MKMDEFLNRNNISLSEFKYASLSWNSLLRIGLSHAAQTPHLKKTAIILSSILQQVDEVHSVRWRIKKPEHLMAKIIRKRNTGNKKYSEISEHNYQQIITDLIGIRVLYLYKKDWEKIHHFICSMWKQIELPIVYLRAGDPDSEIKVYNNNGCQIKYHDAGYRSTHYLIKPLNARENFVAEIQIRTIFEEGWSEIDHLTRYSGASDSYLLRNFLMIFNRLAGSADEMGTFILELKKTLDKTERDKAINNKSYFKKNSRKIFKR
ncbi:RelA/SpoT domain-containing protein [Escherichia albertii]